MMVMEAIVKEDGTLIADVPKSLWGKKIHITITESVPEKQKTQTPTQWDAISAALHDARTLSLPRRTANDILTELRDFRESQ